MGQHDAFDILECKLHALKDKIKREDEVMSHLWNDAHTRVFASYLLEDNIEQSKSIIKAKVLKMKGNEQFQARDYLDSIQSYSECAMYAPEGSPQYSVAIANRSASLFYLNRYKSHVSQKLCV